jgi:tetratricopeptide (TPR) repeat protein
MHKLTQITTIATLCAAPFVASGAIALASWFQTYVELGDKALLRDPKQAIHYYDLAETKLESSKSPTYDKARLDFNRAKASLNLDEKKKAIEFIQKSLQENPKRAVPEACNEERKLLAELLFETEQHDEAEKVSRELRLLVIGIQKTLHQVMSAT